MRHLRGEDRRYRRGVRHRCHRDDRYVPDGDPQNAKSPPPRFIPCWDAKGLLPGARTEAQRPGFRRRAGAAGFSLGRAMPCWDAKGLLPGRGRRGLGAAAGSAAGLAAAGLGAALAAAAGLALQAWVPALRALPLRAWGLPQAWQARAAGLSAGSRLRGCSLCGVLPLRQA